MENEELQNVLKELGNIESDNSIPKHIRLKIKEAIDILNDNEKYIGLRVGTSLEHLSELTDDPNLPPYSRMQIWSIVSQLESN